MKDTPMFGRCLPTRRSHSGRRAKAPGSSTCFSAFSPLGRWHQLWKVYALMVRASIVVFMAELSGIHATRLAITCAGCAGECSARGRV